MLRRLSIGDKSDSQSSRASGVQRESSPSRRFQEVSSLVPKPIFLSDLILLHRIANLKPWEFQTVPFVVASKNKTKYSILTQMFRCMEKGKWGKVRKILKASGRNIRDAVDASGLTPLALAVSYQAPENIVREILSADPESPLQVDSFGATPLHLACLNGTTPDIVRMIICQDNGQSAKAVDHDNYSVLHHAVEYICIRIDNWYENAMDLADSKSLESDSFDAEFEDYLEIIKLICYKAPQTVHCKTNDSGDTPLDIPNIILLKPTSKHPQMQERLLEVYRLLKKTSVHVYREQRRVWEGARARGNKAGVQCDGSIPSIMSSTASLSAVSQSLSLFKDSLNSNETGNEMNIG